MNVFTGNALLKMLEEPPESTVFILITDALDRLLPTILSRCRKVALAPPKPDVALAWLTGQGVTDAERLLAEEGGAPLAALRAAQEDEVRGPQREALFAALARPELASCLAVAERLAKCESALVVGWIQRWVYDCLGYRLAGRIRYYPSQKSAIATLAGSLDVTRALAYARTLVAENRLVDHPLNARLFVENLLLGYCLALQKV
jgi:DNA polymerase-3 subunit delta'